MSTTFDEVKAANFQGNLEGNVRGNVDGALVKATIVQATILQGLLEGTVNGPVFGAVQLPVQALDKSGEITLRSGLVVLAGAEAVEAHLPDPESGADDGKVLYLVAVSAAAHKVSNKKGGGFNGGGAKKDVATLSGAIGDGLVVVAYGGVWYVLSAQNVSIA